jgi:oligopeptide/dipeptide ABC transporter ATP-binding protein
VAVLLGQVGLSAAHANRYPHEFSGGQRQRIGIARAIALQPKFIVCDEPVSALDVSVQAQVLNLLADLKASLGLTFLFIAHNLAVVRQFCERVAVMYLGRIVEEADSPQLFADPRHPYTRALWAAAPDPDRRGRVVAEPATNPIDPPSPLDVPGGCAFFPRCRFATDLCRRERPELRALDGPTGSHRVACHHAETLPAL